jgi:hypothetical protein
VPHVVLVLPGTDRGHALTMLRARSVASQGTDWVRDGHDLLAEWFDDVGARGLAHRTFLTARRTRPRAPGGSSTCSAEELGRGNRRAQSSRWCSMRATSAMDPESDG